MEEVVKEKKEKKEVWKKNDVEKNKPINLDKISNEERKRVVTTDKELNRVLGGGIVPGSVILIGGEPGIGKSTLMLQFVLALKKLKTLYVSGEESKEQIKIRSERIGQKNENCFIYTETNLESLFLALFLLAHALIPINELVMWGAEFKMTARDLFPSLYFFPMVAYYIDGALLYLCFKALVFKDFSLTKIDLFHFIPLMAYITFIGLVF